MGSRNPHLFLDDQKKMRQELKLLRQEVPDTIKRLNLLEQGQLELSERMDRLSFLGKELRDLRERLNRLERLEQKLLTQKPPQQKPPK